MINEIFTHRSIRSYRPEQVPAETIQRITEAAIRASNTGNMQVYSIVVTTDPAIREELSPCHFNQPMVRQAPVHITFCVDVHRFSLWCRQRGAEPAYDNFIWFINGTVDVILAAQNLTLAAESEGLGICYLGTASYNADRIIEILHLPEGVIPVTALVMGWPAATPAANAAPTLAANTPALTDRLPVEGVVHHERYTDYSPEDIDRIWAEREASELTARLIEENGLPNLATIFTENRYKAGDNLFFSRKFFETLKKQGFFNQ